MTTTTVSANPKFETSTSFGGENVVGFRVIRAYAAKSTGSKTKRTLREANLWLLQNAAKVDAHAKASTKRLIGRESV